MKISLIVAASDNNVIGGHNQLLWKLPDDMKRLKELTMGKPLIMGRKTHESVGRVLPGRRNIVITRHPEKVMEGAEAVGSLQEALKLALADDAEEAIIFGGGEIYTQALPLADSVYMTRVHGEFEGDTYFPELPKKEWKEVWSEEHEKDDKHAYAFTFQNWQRKAKN
nr:Dihydrofolate reductase [uncultured bacterium]